MDRRTGIWIDNERAVIVTLTSFGTTIERERSEAGKRVRHAGGSRSKALYGSQEVAEEPSRDASYQNLGYIAGWSMQYNLKAALEVAIANGDLTRAGILAAANSLTEVDYEGMIPSKTFVGTPAEVTERSSVVHQIDVNASDGLTVFQDLFIGPTAAEYPFTAPCAVLGG